MNDPLRHAAAGVASMLLVGLLSVSTALAAPPPSLAAPSPALPALAAPTTGLQIDQVVSDDGRLTVTLPVGALPDDVTPTIEAVTPTVPAVAAYRLLPLDLRLSALATAAWRLDPATGSVDPTKGSVAPGGDLPWLELALSADPASQPWMRLADPRVDVTNGAYVTSGRIDRFGIILVTQVPTLVRGPEAIWGPGYAPGLGIEVPMDLTLVTSGGTPSTSAFSGDWRFGDGYPDVIDVAASVSEADHLAATWRCQRIGDTSLTTTFGVREDPQGLGPASQSLGLAPAAAAFSVTFPVACGRVHARPNG